jgi:cyclopropane fatty-acyl-phospholipid synthase-like methyltransferase
MRYLNFFEEFTDQTLNINNDTYNDYLKRNSKSRSKMVAWEQPGSQIKNFRFTSKFINDNDSLLDYGCGVGDFIKYLKKEKNISDYLGVDINDNFIKKAIEYYPDNKFQLIKSVDELNGKFDTVCAIGVFTWFITKDDFIKTINKLHEICNKQVLITCLYSSFNFDSESYWESNYRYYNKELFENLFPNLDIEYKYLSDNTMLVKINK